MNTDDKRLKATLYKNALGREPVRDWIKALLLENRKTIGSDIKTVEFGCSVGIPVCRSLGKGL